MGQKLSGKVETLQHKPCDGNTKEYVVLTMKASMQVIGKCVIFVGNLQGFYRLTTVNLYGLTVRAPVS